MRTFEFKDGKSNKFWNIALKGKAFTVTFGKIGTAGQSQEKKFSSDAAARTAHDKLVAEKLAKGYVETSAGTAAPASSTAGKALENAILANPDDLGAHAAYADWLIEQGDPRGEFIQVQLALEDPKVSRLKRLLLKRREKTLLKKHGKNWLGSLAEFLWNKKRDEALYVFSRGWLDRIGIAELTGPVSRVLGQAPQARLLGTLYIGHIDSGLQQWLENLPGDAPGLAPLIDSPYLGNVRRLAIGDVFELRDSVFHYTTLWRSDLTEVTALVKRLPHLEELLLAGEMKDVNGLFGLKALKNLRSLQLCFAAEYPLEVLARNSSLGKLASILFHAQAGEATITRDGLRALLQSPHLKSLAKLRLHQHTIGDEGCADIVQSGILKRLTVLDLGFGNITDEGVRILAACPDLRHLELLDLQRNGLTKKGIATLRKVGIDVHADQQHDPGDTSYLYEGEME